MTRARLADLAACDVEGAPIAAAPLSAERVRRSLLRILQENLLCSIATVSGDGRAHINTAYFCYSDELELYFLSHPASLHCRNLTANPSTAVAVFATRQRWVNPGRGVQLFGRGSQAKGALATKAARLYGRRFPAYARWKARLSKANPARAYRLYRFLPASLKLLDEASFGDAVWVRALVVSGGGPA